MTKHTLLTCTFLTLSLFAIAQNPVTFDTKFERTGDKTGTITFSGTIADGWHIYSTELDGGPIAASFNIDKAENCSTAGKLRFDGNELSKFDDMFGMKVRYFEKQVVFYQDVTIDSDDFKIEGYLEYGACNDENCLPPTAVNFSFGDAGGTQPATVATTTINIQPVALPTADNEQDSQISTDKLWAPVQYQSSNLPTTDTSKWAVFWSCFLFGFIALLTPCVWPIIPMTVSFFLKRSSNRGKGIADSIVYGLSIIVIYLSLGLAITYIAGPNALNAMSTNAIFNLIFTAMLVVFGVSFLGAFEITLPSSWSTAVDTKASQTRGFLSIFLMAFTLSLVSFSCTGPIIGFLLVQVSTSGDFMAPAIGMAGFAIALALPFTLFALFPSMLKKMPKSGSWMETIKVVLGFVELAFALKFFSVADLAYGWHLLDRETFIAIWASLAFALGLYLFGVVRLGHDDEPAKPTGIVRLFGGMAAIAFAIYLIPGLWGAPLKAVSAFAPPLHTQDFDLAKTTPQPKFKSYKEGMAFAAANNKPALIDFTGHGCANCRKMELSVWSDPRVADLINNEFVLISLYVDDKTPLPERITVDEYGTTTILRTVGDKWSYLQRHKFGVAAQPFYVILNDKGELMAQPYAFDEDPEHFIEFLNSALDK